MTARFCQVMSWLTIGASVVAMAEGRWLCLLVTASAALGWRELFHRLLD